MVAYVKFVEHLTKLQVHNVKSIIYIFGTSQLIRAAPFAPSAVKFYDFYAFREAGVTLVSFYHQTELSISTKLWRFISQICCHISIHFEYI